MMRQNLKYSLVFAILLIALLFANLIFGSISIPLQSVFDILLCREVEKDAWYHIILEYRLPQAITAVFTGAALAVAGLLLQTAFRNPLADSGILGISAGANLGVALVVLVLGSSFGASQIFSLSYSVTIVLGAFLGAVVILAIIMAFASVIRNNIMVLIIGIMVGYLTSSVISILNFWTTSEKAYSFMLWGMGDFSGVSLAQLPFYCTIVILGLLLSILLIKPLNALLLGENYAANLGVNIKTIRFLLLLCAGLLTAVTTAYCGPISFIGLAVPHISRLIFSSSNHKILIPYTIALGAIVALLCNLISVISGSIGLIPINAITPLFGAPVIIYVIINQKRIQYFN